MAKLNYQKTSNESRLSRQPALKSRKSENQPLVKTPKFKAKPKSKKPVHKKRDFTKHPLVGSVQLSDVRLPRSARITMPFGKYKGYLYEDIPLEYVQWALMNVPDTTIKEKMLAEIKKRS